MKKFSAFQIIVLVQLFDPAFRELIVMIFLLLLVHDAMLVTYIIRFTFCNKIHLFFPFCFQLIYNDWCSAQRQFRKSNQ